MYVCMYVCMNVCMYVMYVMLCMYTVCHCLFSSTQVSYYAKRIVYTGLILSILLYGSESWCLTEVLYNKLRIFHSRCVRTMCRVTRKHTWKHRISTDELLQRLNMKSIDKYILKRQLRWAGHVARMKGDRLPRKMMSSWVRSKRPRGAPQFTYGRGLIKSLKKANVNTKLWHSLAQNRDSWRDMIRNI